MKRLVLCFFMLQTISASAQFRNTVYSNWEGGYMVGASGRYQASSNALTSNLLWNAYQGKFLERELRDRVSGMHGKSNRLGADIDYGLFARHLPDSTKGIGWFVSLADRTHVNGSYAKELFDLVAFGNAKYAGQRIMLSPLRFNFLSYTQAEVGIMKVVKKQKGTWNIGFGLSVLFGKQNINLNIDGAELFTDADGEFLDGMLSGSVRSASASSTQYFAANGIGFSGSLAISYSTDKWGIGLEADDLGMINWNKLVKQTDLDTVFRFEGVEVDLFSGGNAFADVSADSLLNGLATDVPVTKYTTTTPGSIRLEGHYVLNQKQLRLYAGVHYRFAAGYIPFAYVGTNSPLGKGFFVDGRFAYGGFGSWNLGLEFRKRFGKHVEVRLGTNNLEGFVLPMVGTSQSAYLNLVAFF